jgi:hypothetical protein
MNGTKVQHSTHYNLYVSTNNGRSSLLYETGVLRKIKNDVKLKNMRQLKEICVSPEVSPSVGKIRNM